MRSPEVAADPFAITLFGPMQVYSQGQLLPPFRARKVGWLLALLTLRPDRPVEREWLAGTLWPDLGQSQAYANLRPTLSELRKALGVQCKRLQSPDRLTLVLDLTHAEVDICRFDAAIKSGKLSDLERAVALYGGPLLAGCNEEWILQERASRQQGCLQALQHLGDAALAAGNYETAVGYYQRAASIDPWSDIARRGWMEALARNGDSNGALHVYREFLDLLKNDPTAAPDAQTIALYQRLRAAVRQRTGALPAITAQATTVPTITGYLPHPRTELVGREDECLDIAARLLRSRLVTLTGLGGIGKTRLALAVASESMAEYADGVWLVALEALTEGKLLPRQIASVLGLKEEPGRPLLTSLIDHLRNKHLLLVLDNCEHLLEASAHMAAHLLRDCAEVHILATSREALGIAGETTWAVPALTVPAPERLPHAHAHLPRALMEYESVQLFVERAQAVQKAFALTGENAAAVVRVCSQLEGIPLAIELAAARGKTLTVEQIATRIGDHLSQSTDGSGMIMPRQQTLRVTLDWSYALLSESERRLLRRLSVFVGGWRLEAAEAVCAGEGITSPQVLSLLLSLIEKSLVVFHGSQQEADGRYHLLEMLRQYAAERLQASGEMETVKRRHQEGYMNFAVQAGQALITGEQAVWLSRLETEHQNLRAVLDWDEATVRAAETGLRLAGALSQYWSVRGRFTEGREYLDRVLGKDGAQSRTAVRAKALSGAGSLAYYQSDYAAARSLYHESLGIRKELQDKLGTAVLFSKLGQMEFDSGDYAAARLLYNESLSLRRELGDQRGIADSVNTLGILASNQGDYPSARVLYEESLSIHRKLGEKLSIATLLQNLGTVAYHQADYVSAWSLTEESLNIRRELGDNRGIASSLHNLGNLAIHQCEYATAREFCEESLSIHRELEDKRGIALLLLSLGNLAIHQCEYATAREFYEESLSIHRELGHKRRIALLLGNMGELAYAQCDFASAQSLYEESLSLWKELGDKSGIAYVLAGLGNLAHDRSDYSAAQALHRECLHLFRDISDLWGVAESLSRLAAVLLAHSEPQQAACLLSAAHMLHESISVPLRPADRQKYDRLVAQARSAISEEAFAAAWEQGRTLTWKQAVAFALAEAPR